MVTAIRRAILKHFKAQFPDAQLRKEHSAYLSAPVQNLVRDLDSSVLSDFDSGDGGELTGDPPKFCAVHSSAALAANSFGLFRLRPKLLSLAGLSRFTDARFEAKLPTGLRGTPPNLDFFIQSPDGIVAVESKFTEFLTTKVAKFSTAYGPLVDRVAAPGWRDTYLSLIDDPARYSYLDAAQLLKHYLGLEQVATRDGVQRVLIYVFWEPQDAPHLEPFTRHREEVADFLAAVGPSRVAFLPMSYPELWDTWDNMRRWPERAEYLSQLRLRYSLAVRSAT